MPGAAHTIDHLREQARRRIPRLASDFLEGGAGGERSLARNLAAFAECALLPRVLTGCERRSGVAELFGRRYAAPFGIAPIGLAGLIWPGADLGLARAAAATDIPYVLSTAGTATIEEIAEAAPANAWFQLYVGRDQAIVDDLIARAEQAGIGVLVVTVDVPAPGKRVRDLANGFALPLRPSLRMALDIAGHPAWALATRRAGPPRFANLERYVPPQASAQSLAALMAGQSSARLDWALLGRIRERWRGRLVVKGVLHPEDAARLVALGMDGIVVSNHGGRQLDAAPATLHALPAVRAAVGRRAAVLLDGGVRSGEDLAKALASGADFVLLGRPFLYGVAAQGPERGPAEVIRILTAEFDGALAQLGCATPGDLGPGHLWRAGTPAASSFCDPAPSGAGRPSDTVSPGRSLPWTTSAS